MNVVQPAAKMLVELSKSQDIVAGDGTTTGQDLVLLKKHFSLNQKFDFLRQAHKCFLLLISIEKLQIFSFVSYSFLLNPSFLFPFLSPT